MSAGKATFAVPTPAESCVHFVSLTRVRLRSPYLLLPWMLHSARAMRSMHMAPGRIVTATRKTRGLAFWCLTVWKSEAAMRAHRTGGAALFDLERLRYWCDEAASVTWRQDTAELPPWDEAEERLRSSAQLHRVEHPSPAQRGWIISVD
jgi:hypothetical protein